MLGSTTPAVKAALEAPPQDLHRPHPLAHLQGSEEARTDKILLHGLGAYPDEREYRRVYDSNTSVSSALLQRRDGALDEGFQVLPGKAGNETAKRLAKFGSCMLSSIPPAHYRNWIRDLFSALHLGWQPSQLQWDRAVRFDGKDLWGIKRVERADPHLLAWSVPDGEGNRFLRPRSLVLRQSDIWSDPDYVRWHWHTAIYGDSSSPYGRSVITPIWLESYAMGELTKANAEGARLSVGLLKLKQVESEGGKLTEVQFEARALELMRRLRDFGILLQSEGIETEWLTSGTFTQSHAKLSEMLEQRITRGLLRQNLTTNVEGGSLAAAKVHESVLHTIHTDDGGQMADWHTTLLAKGVDANFSDIAPDEYPRAVSGWSLKVDEEKLRIFLDYGGAADGRAVGEAFKIPLPADLDEEEPLTLRKQAAVAPQEPPFAPQADDLEEARGLARLRTSRPGEGGILSTETGGAQLLDDVNAAAQRRASDALASIMRGLDASYRRERPGPKA